MEESHCGGTGENKQQPLREIKEKDAEMLNHSITEVGRDFQDHLVQPTLKAGIIQQTAS